MQQVAAVRSVKQAVRMLKHMKVQSPAQGRTHHQGIACSVPSLTFPMQKFEVPRYVEFFLTPTASASESTVVVIRVMGQTACGPQAMGGTELVGFRDDFVDVPPQPVASSLAFYPNPASGSLLIQLESPRNQSAEVKVYDVSGRFVRDLGVTQAAAGTTEIRWDGRDHNGRRVHSGFYLVRVKTDDKLVTRRVSILK
jgi:hypothetical protein